MASPTIKIKRSSVAGKVPHYPSTLDVGEFAINTADGKVFIAAGVDGVGVGVTVREVGISTENLLSQSLRVDGDTDLNGDLSVSDVASFNHAKFVGVITSTSFHGNINSTGISTISGFRFPSSDGDEDQALVTDGSGSLSFKTLSGGGGATGAATTISTGISTATAGQTVFTPSDNDTTAKNIEVYQNGIRLELTQDFTKGSPQITIINPATGLEAGDELDVVITR